MCLACARMLACPVCAMQRGNTGPPWIVNLNHSIFTFLPHCTANVPLQRYYNMTMRMLGEAAHFFAVLSNTQNYIANWRYYIIIVSNSSICMGEGRGNYRGESWQDGGQFLSNRYLCRMTDWSIDQFIYSQKSLPLSFQQETLINLSSIKCATLNDLVSSPMITFSL